jgi:hypothetical protein
MIHFVNSGSDESAALSTEGTGVLALFAPRRPLPKAEGNLLPLGLPLARRDEVGAEGAGNGVLLLQSLAQEPGGDLLPQAGIADDAAEGAPAVRVLELLLQDLDQLLLPGAQAEPPPRFADAYHPLCAVLSDRYVEYTLYVIKSKGCTIMCV